MKCFVIMPFGNRQSDPIRARQLDLLYDELIKPAVESVIVPGSPGERIICHRGDKEASPGEVITHIVENLVGAEIAIADLSGRNPNVFYELGVRHAVNDNTVLIAQSEDDIPFDLRGQRFIIYQCDFEGGVRLRNALVRTIEDILRNPKRTDNPVRRFLFNQQKEKIEERGTPPGFDLVKDLVSEIACLRSDFKEQVREVRQIMSVVTAPQTIPVARILTEEFDFMEGVWRSLPDGSLFCARVIHGDLLMPYCYAGDDSLTAHLYNIRILGDNVFARFQWIGEFCPPLSGFIFAKVESKSRLKGGWWYSDDLPAEVTKDMTLIKEYTSGMNRWILEKVEGGVFPLWAEEYFSRAEHQEGL